MPSCLCCDWHFKSKKKSNFYEKKKVSFQYAHSKNNVLFDDSHVVVNIDWFRSLCGYTLADRKPAGRDLPCNFKTEYRINLKKKR